MPFHNAKAALMLQADYTQNSEHALEYLKVPQISRSWTAHWDNLNTLFNSPVDIRRAIYTTNAIESLNSVIRKAIKKRKLFPTDESARKVI
ncbi:hypothetical protein VINE108521_13015 [Vibrio neonatus]